MTISSNRIKSAEVFVALTPIQRERVAEKASLVHAEAGQVVFHGGDPADRLFIVDEGKVGGSLDVGERILQTLSLYGPGQLIGISSFFPHSAWRLTARALVPSTLISLPSRWLQAQLLADSDFAVRIYEPLLMLMRERLNAMVNVMVGRSATLSG